MILQNFTLITCLYWSNEFFSSCVVSTHGMIDSTAEELTKVFCKKTSNKDFKLEDLKKVLFAEKCEFPRFKLSNFTDIKRALKPSTADAIIFTQEIVHKHLERNSICCFSELHQMYYLIDCRYVKDVLKKVDSNYIDLSEEDRIKKAINLAKEKKVLPEDAKFVSYRIFTKISDHQIKNYGLLTSGKPLIVAEDLNKKLTGTLDKADDEILKSIDELLGSSDPGSVGMDMDLLINFNVLDKSCPNLDFKIKNRSIMINNKQLFIDMLPDSPIEDLVFYCQIIKRKKDHPGLEDKNNSARLIKPYYFACKDDMEKRWEEMVSISEATGARIMMDCFCKSKNKVKYEMLSRLADIFKTGNDAKLHRLYNTCYGSMSAEKGHRSFLIDWDDKDTSKIREIFREIKEYRIDFQIIHEIPTRQGMHFIVKPFDIIMFLKICKERGIKNIDIHKSSPSLVYLPNSIS